MWRRRILEAMRHFAVSAVGRDRPGIVATVSEALLSHHGNIEDSQMAILRGHFTMTLIVATPDGEDAERLAADLAGAKEALELDALSVSEVTGIDPASEPVPSHIVSVYGADHPGIVHAVSSILAARGVSITDLETRLAGGAEGEPVYTMLLEVAVSADADPSAIERDLAEAAYGQHVELSFRPLELDAL
jgi:glycine cleavage system transcriptional repressor